MHTTFAITPSGPLPGAVIFGVLGVVLFVMLVSFRFDPNAATWGLWLGTGIIGAVAVLIGLFVFHDRSQAVRITDTDLILKAPFYGRSVPLTALDTSGIQALDLKAQTNRDFRLTLRSNGVGLRRLQLGWFRLGVGEKAWCYITDPTSVIYIPTTEGFSILVSTDSPDAIKAALTR